MTTTTDIVGRGAREGRRRRPSTPISSHSKESFVPAITKPSASVNAAFRPSGRGISRLRTTVPLSLGRAVTCLNDSAAGRTATVSRVLSCVSR